MATSTNSFCTRLAAPRPGPGEVLIRVGACGLNNTDVNTRTGWYSKAVSEATTGSAYAEVHDDDPTWGGAPIAFRASRAPMSAARSWPWATGSTRPASANASSPTAGCATGPIRDKDKTGYFGSEARRRLRGIHHDAGPQCLAIRQSDLSDAELATFSCSYSTAEGMLTRAG
jgi:hypothetical protein